MKIERNIKITSLIIGLIIGGGIGLLLGISTNAPQNIAFLGDGNQSHNNVDLSTFWEVWDKIEQNFFTTEKINQQDMVYGAIRGLVSSLNDPYTTFFIPETAEIFQKDLTGSIEGVGMEVGIRDDQLTIISPLENTPAQKIGLKPLDRIIEIDGRPTQNLSLEECINFIRGEKGTSVTLVINRESVFDRKNFTLIRQVINIPSVELTIIDESIAHLQILHFHQNSSHDFNVIAKQILNDNSIRGIILDVRNNPGGYLEITKQIAEWFLSREDVIVIEHLGENQKKIIEAYGNENFVSYPLVVLINRGSASGSEILASALRDNRGIKLIGEQSFGKGTVQQPIEIQDNSLLKITIAEWRTPNDQSIDGVGLIPDLEIKNEDQKQDLQLEKAIEVIKNIIK